MRLTTLIILLVVIFVLTYNPESGTMNKYINEVQETQQPPPPPKSEVQQMPQVPPQVPPMTKKIMRFRTYKRISINYNHES